MRRRCAVRMRCIERGRELAISLPNHDAREERDDPLDDLGAQGRASAEKGVDRAKIVVLHKRALGIRVRIPYM